MMSVAEIERLTALPSSPTCRMRRRIPTIRRTGASVPNGNPGLFWGDGRPWHSYVAYCRRHFGGRVRKIAVDAGLSCPNRDGTIGSEVYVL